MFYFVVRNPCIDRYYVDIVQKPMADYAYCLYDEAPLGLQWTHAPFEVQTWPIQHTLCGEFAYEAYFMDEYVTDETEPLRYDSSTLTFSLYSEDFDMIGEHLLEFQAWFEDYPSTEDEIPAIITYLSFDDPCPDPDSVTATL